jgi:hypothetical protein
MSWQLSPPRPSRIAVFPSFGTHVILSNRSIQCFLNISLSALIKTLNLENNEIVDFVGFAPSTSLEALKLANNPITSLRGMPHLPKLRVIDLSNSPFAKHQFHRVALLILFGKTLRIINGVRISLTERQLAASYPPGCDALLRGGWTISFPPPAPADLPRLTSSFAATIPRISRPIGHFH